MGRARGSEFPEGTREKRGKIQINFTWNGERQWATLKLTATPANFTKAAKIRADLVKKAEFNILTEKDIEEATGKKMTTTKVATFAHYAQQYLYSLTDHKIGTKEKYLSALDRLWMPRMGEMPINSINGQFLRLAVNSIEWGSPKGRNDALIPLRGTFALAYEDEVIDKNPCERIKNQKNRTGEPDPFNSMERDILLRWMKDKYQQERPEIYLYFVVAFWTGLRPSEQIALTWEDVDFVNHQILIKKGRVAGVQQDSTKTNKSRFVDMNEYALAAFEKLRELTYLKYDHVFICSETGEAYATQKSLTRRLTAAIKSNGIRHRPSYNTRHTYATICLMSGLNPVYVAAQLGHSLVMLTKHYARWIDGEKNKQEIAKISNSAKIVPEAPKLMLTT